ncbi:MAG: ATP-binding domain-containing protein [Phycisphaerales bacterium]|jgi:hypothetical protein
MLAVDYVGAVAAGKTALVVSPTHLEGEWITAEIRSELKRTGKVGQEDRVLPILENVNLTEAERSDAVNYQPDQVLVFHQNAKGFTKGDRLAVGSAPIPVQAAARFQVFRRSSLEVARGDVLRITRNGATADGRHKLNNGALFTVKNFDAEGNLVLTNGWTIGRDYGHLAHGYCVTSHSSQGKTVDRVFIGQSSESLPASSREQFYVSVSRGRESAVVYTDDKQALMEAVERADDRVTATEFVRQRVADMQRRESAERRPDPQHRNEPEREELIHG